VFVSHFFIGVIGILRVIMKSFISDAVFTSFTTTLPLHCSHSIATKVGSRKSTKIHVVCLTLQAGNGQLPWTIATSDIPLTLLT